MPLSLRTEEKSTYPRLPASMSLSPSHPLHSLLPLLFLSPLGGMKMQPRKYGLNWSLHLPGPGSIKSEYSVIPMKAAMGHDSCGVNLGLSMTSAGTSKLCPLFPQRACQMLGKGLGTHVRALVSALASLYHKEGYCIHGASGQRKSHFCVSSPHPTHVPLSNVLEQGHELGVYLRGDLRGTGRGTNR
jgi:hypothetical protein